jgi:hypothetical protein
LDGAGEGQIFLRNPAASVMGAKPKGDSVPTIMDFWVMILPLGDGSHLVYEG